MALKVGELYAALTVDSKGFDKGIDDSKRKMDSLGDSGGSVFDNIGRMALRAVGGVSALSVAITGVAVAGAAATGLAASMAAAGIGAAAYGAVAVGALKGVFEAANQVDTIQKKIDNASSTKERIAAEKELANVYSGMGESQRGALEQLQNFKSFWGDFVKQFETPIFDTFGEGLALVKNILTGLSPTISNVAGVVKVLVSELNNTVVSGGLTEFFSWLETNAAPSLANFVHTSGNLLAGFFNIMMAFSEHGASMEQGLLSLSERFRDWSASLAESQGFQQFIDYVKTNGPVLLQIVGDVLSVLGSLITVVAPLGQVLLQGLSVLTGPLAEGFSSLVEKLSSAKGSFDQFKNALVTGFQIAWSVISPLVTLIGQKVMEVFSSVIEWWNSNGSQLMENVGIVFRGIWSIIQFVMPAILAIVSMVFESVKGVIMGALNIIGGTFKIFAALFTGDWSKLWDGVKQLLSGALEFLWNLWNLMMMGRFVSGIKALGVKIGEGFAAMWANVKSLFTSFIESFKSSTASFVSGVIAKITEFASRFKNIFETMRAFGLSIWQALVQTVRNLIQDFISGAISRFNSFKSSVTSVFNAVKTAITGPIESAKTTVLGIIDKIVGAFSAMKITIPKPKLPKINVGSTTMFGGKGGIPAISVPTFSVDWFKTGGIATGPAIAGIGEAGSEAIIPMSGRRMKPFANEIAKQIGGSGGGVVINMYGDNYYSDEMDISYVSEKLGDEVDRKLRMKGGRN